MSKNEHYHYSFLYFYSLDNKQLIALWRAITDFEKITNKILATLEDKILNFHCDEGEKVKDVVIFNIKKLKCDCDE